jgi:tRNA U34 5-carboxymethylaminomethyl modifying GTPase MnmE/TrmE
VDPADSIYATAAQRQFLEQLTVELTDVRAGMTAGGPADQWAEHLRQALRQVAAVTGEELDSAVLESIFAQFCIGK